MDKIARYKTLIEEDNNLCKHIHELTSKILDESTPDEQLPTYKHELNALRRYKNEHDANIDKYIIVQRDYDDGDTGRMYWDELRESLGDMFAIYASGYSIKPEWINKYQNSLEDMLYNLCEDEPKSDYIKEYLGYELTSEQLKEVDQIEDFELSDALRLREILTGEEWKHKIIRSYCQGDWAELYYNANCEYISVNEIEALMFGMYSTLYSEDEACVIYYDHERTSIDKYYAQQLELDEDVVIYEGDIA